MPDSKSLISDQARRVLACLPDEDRQLVEAYVNDKVNDQNVSKVRWASTTTAITVISISIMCVLGILKFMMFVSVLPVDRDRCEGWCAHETMDYKYTQGDAYRKEDCTCVTPKDPTRIWGNPNRN